jgi:hypothetical protein
MSQQVENALIAKLKQSIVEKEYGQRFSEVEHKPFRL